MEGFVTTARLSRPGRSKSVLGSGWPGPNSRWLRVFAFGLAVLLGLVSRNHAQPVFSTEYEIKSVLIYNLAQFVEWPASAFDSSTSPIVIGVLGDNVFGSSLEKVIEGETVQNRKLVVQYYHRAADVQHCHLLFITRSESARFEAVLNQLRGKPILTVSDIEPFVGRGGMVRFVAEKNKIRLRLNLGEIEASRLKVSSKLLRIAELVPK